ncbi:TniQ family protein [Paenibacillus beijingensis]|nr:TniQ family protein [Paenibacillus beijingensis]
MDFYSEHNQIINIPERTTLYSLEILSEDTGYIESPFSYMLRLSKAHCLTFRYFLYKFNLQMGHYKRSALSLSKLRNILGKIKYLNSCEKLVNLHFENWDSLFNTRVLFRITRQWCPLCLSDWSQSGKPIFEPFLWTISDCKCCPIHRVNLTSTCPNKKCNKLIYFLENQDYGYCPHCNNPLWGSPTLIFTEKNELIKSNMLMNLIQLSQQNKYILNIAQIINKFGSTEMLKKVKSKPSISRWKNRPDSISLSSFLNVLISLNVHISEIFLDHDPNWAPENIRVSELLNILLLKKEPLTIKELTTFTGWHYQKLLQNFPDVIERMLLRKSAGKIKSRSDVDTLKEKMLLEIIYCQYTNIEAFSKSINLSQRTLKQHCPDLYQKLLEKYKLSRQRKNELNTALISLELDKALLNESPESLTSIAKRIKCPRHILKQRFPVQVKLIVSRFKNNLKDKSIRNKKELEIRLLNAVDELHKDGQYPSKRKLIEKLNVNFTHHSELVALWHYRLKELRYI